MSKLPAARRVEVDGTEMVAVDLQEYQQLRAHRARVGALSTRLHSVRRDLDVLTAHLDDVTRRAQALPACPSCPGPSCAVAGSDCPRSLLLAALADRPVSGPV